MSDQMVKLANRDKKMSRDERFSAPSPRPRVRGRVSAAKSDFQSVLFLVIILSLFALPSCTEGSSMKPAFQIRGIKGLWWEGMDKYRLALPWIANHNMNFLMFCYTSFPASGKDWRANYTADEQAGFRELAKQSEKLGVELCLSFNPGIWSQPPLTYASEADYQFAWEKVKTVHALGVHSFALCLDDINTKLQPADAARFKTLQAAQVYFVNRLWADMRTLSPRPRFIFCPSAYTSGEAENHLDYIKKIAELDPAIFVFWTGPDVFSSTITAKDAEKFSSWIGRKPIVWDNYPVNDWAPWRPLLAPVKNRSKDLGGAVSGLMANPMKQWEASKIPLATLAMYLTDPVGYDPAAARKKLLESYPPAQRAVIESLLRVYGTTFLGEKGFPPKPGVDAKSAADELPRYRLLRQELSKVKELAPLWSDIQPTLESDITSLEKLSDASR